MLYINYFFSLFLIAYVNFKIVTLTPLSPRPPKSCPRKWSSEELKLDEKIEEKEILKLEIETTMGISCCPQPTELFSHTKGENREFQQA